jgi:hypothetical protein
MTPKIQATKAKINKVASKLKAFAQQGKQLTE